MKQVPRLVIVLAALLVIVGLGFGLSSIVNDAEPTPVESSGTPSNPMATPPVEKVQGEPVTKVGTIICLEPLGNGPTTMECASGLKDDSGISYALGSDDPTIVGTIPTGQRVEVVGELTKTEASAKYDMVGKIQVKSLKQL